MFKDNIKNIIKIKNTFIKLPSNKMIKIYNVTSNKGIKEEKPKINIMSGTVHTRVEVCRIDLEMSGLVEQPWLQLMCCAVCLLCSCNFGCWKEVRDGSEC